MITPSEEEESRKAAEKFAKIEHRVFWRDREEGFLKGVEWYAAKHAEEVAKLEERRKAAFQSRDHALQTANLMADRADIAEKALTAAREREEKAAHFINALETVRDIHPCATMEERKELNRIRYEAEEAYDASRAADGKEGA